MDRMKIFIFAYLSMILTTYAQSNNPCRSRRSQEGLKVTCNSTIFSHIPLNLERNIVALDLFYSTIRALKEDSFSRYKDLKEIRLRKCSIRSIEHGTFIHLTSLEILDLSDNPFVQLPPLPESLKILHLDDSSCIPQDGQLSIPKSLVAISLKGNAFATYPQFLKHLVFLEKIELSHNMISKISVDDLAPSCKLRKFYLIDNPTAPWLFEKESGKCQCHLLLKWLKTYDISFKTGDDEFNCPPQVSNQQCNRSWPENANTERNQCFSRIAALQSEKTRVKILLFGGIGLCIVVFLVCLFVCCRRKKKSVKRIKHFEGNTRYCSDKKLRNDNDDEERYA